MKFRATPAGASPQGDPVRIAYLLPTLEVGGTERALVALLEGLPSERFERHVVCLSGFGPLEAEARRAGATLHDLGYARLREGGAARLGKAATVAVTVGRLARLLRRERIDILHTMIPVANILGAFAGRIARVPRVCCSKLSLANYRDTNRPVAVLESLTDRWFDLVHCKSQGIVEDVARREPIPRGRMRVVYNGLRTEQYEGIGGELVRRELGIGPVEFVVGMVANLIPYKGHRDMLNAAAEIVAAQPATRLLFVGRDDGIGGELMAQAASLGIGENLLLAGSRRDIPQVMAAMDCLVSASHEEGFSNVIIEAMASALPVVATRVGGNPEAVDDGVTGLIAEPRSPAGLAKAVLTLIGDREGARAMGQRGRVRARELFSYGAMIRGMEEFYAELMGGGHLNAKMPRGPR